MRPSVRKSLVLYLALANIFAPIAPAFSQSRPALPELGSPSTPKTSTPARTPDWLLNVGTDQDLAPAALRKRSQGIEQAISQGANMLSSATSNATQNWFADRQITAEMAVKIEPGGIKGGSLDVLLPLHDSGNSLVFTQAGIRRADSYTTNYRNTLNLGLGQRQEVAGLLLGSNMFYDRDLTAGHSRLGMGVEAWTDFLKFTGNSYLPLSDWKKAPDRIDYSERPAKGWDVRAEGYLPAYPQLGGKLMYEQYYGEAVSLFSADSLQKDPRAVTLSALYNPVPLLSLALNQRIGQGGKADTSANLSITYHFGEPLAKQLSRDSLRDRHLLATMRHDLVARNNEMVMDYRKKAAQLRLPATLPVTENQTVTFTLTGTANLRSLTWAGSAAGFAAPYAGGQQGTLTIPGYVPAGDAARSSPADKGNVYSLAAVGIDRNGREVTSNTMAVIVHAVGLSVTASPTTLEADGISSSQLIARVEDRQGLPTSAGLTVNWKTSAGTLSAPSSVTNNQGVATVMLTSATQTGMATVEATTGSAKDTTTVTFTAGDPAFGAQGVTLEAATDTITADGKSSTTLTATVKDDFGNPVAAGTPVAWSSSAGMLAQPSSVTASDGKATMLLTSWAVAGTATVKAKAGAGADSLSVAFVPGAPAPGHRGLILTVDTAPGADTAVLKATVMDANHNHVGAGLEVNWTSTAGTLADRVSITDAHGVASTVLSNTTGGALRTFVEATSGAASDRIHLAFMEGVPAVGSDGLSLAVDAMDTSNVAVLTATVVDAFGDPVSAGEKVSWKTTSGTLASSTSFTDANGKATNTLMGTQGSSADVTASSGDASDTLTVRFIPGTPAEGHNGIGLLATRGTLPADGSSTTEIRATVRDAQGHSVGSGVSVNWRVDLGTLASASSVTDTHGVARIVLTSATKAAMATVEASSGTARNAITLEYLPGMPNDLSIVASSDSLIANGLSTSALLAIVEDAQGNPVGAGHQVNWSTSAGRLANASSMTDANGHARVTLTSPTVAGTATITARIAAATVSTEVHFISGAAASLAVVPSPTSIEANGNSTTTLTATLLDAHGNPLDQGVVVHWATSAGTLASNTSLTNAQGRASVVLTSSTVAGTASIQAWVGFVKGTATVLYTPGPTATVTVSASATTLPTLASSTSTISARLTDANGNPVGAGVVVNWEARHNTSSSGGRLSSSSSVTNASGVATVVLSAPARSGTVTVSASVGSATGSTQVTFSLTMTLSATRFAIPRNGQATFTVTVTTPDGQPVSGVNVEWDTGVPAQSAALSELFGVTDSQGVAHTVLTNTASAQTYGTFSVWLRSQDYAFRPITLQ